MSYTVTQRMLTNNDCYKSGKRITPIGMQLHTIGTAQNTAESLAEYWNQSGVEACVHYCIDAETEGKVLQFMPENYRSWADGGFGNGNCITVELMESDYMRYTSGSNYTITDEAKFKADITRAYNTAVEFFADVCKAHGWDPTAKLSNGLYTVSSHYEGNVAGLSTNHVDPTHVWSKLGFTMDGFRSEVKAKMNGESTDKYYRIRLSWNNEASQIGAYKKLSVAKQNCPAGYTVYDWDGNAKYTVKLPTYTAGKTYQVLIDKTNVRSGVGTDKDRVSYDDLPASLKVNAYKASGKLKSGAKVKCVKSKVVNGTEVWMKVAKGCYIAAFYNNKKRIG